MFEEEPIWYPIYSNDFEKSTTLLDELEEDYYIDESGVKRKRKGYNLKNLEISEISLCRSGKVDKTYYVKKGEDNIMDEDTTKKVEKSNFRWSGDTQRALLGYSDEDLEKVSDEDLEIEKSSNSNPFPSLARIFNRNKEVSEEYLEVEKSSNTNPFPSLARIFNNNKRVLEEVYEEYAIREGARFI